MDLSNYTTQLVAIINLSDLQPSNPTESNPDYVVNVLAKHDATSRVEVLVLAKNNGGVNKFKHDFPNAGVIVGNGTPDNHDEWRMLAFPREVQDSTSPVEIFNRGKSNAHRRANGQGIINEH